MKIEFIKYIPTTERYHIYYPKDYLLKEDESGIVTITSPNGETNMTISGYEANREVDTWVLTELLATATIGYELRTEPKIEQLGQRLGIGGKYRKNGDDWLWKIYSEENAIVIVSINGDGVLTKEQISINEFILRNLEIYPS